MRGNSTLRFAAVFSCLALFTGPSLSDEGQPIGITLKVVNEVKAELNQASRVLATRDDVRQNELISVSQDGLGEIQLEDETKLALGPGAKLKLDQFVYDPNKTGGAIVINMTRGAFRFITGLAKKPSYVIRTPSASITVRGTIFDGYIEEDGGLWLLLHEGGIQVCNDRGKCQELADPCQSLRIGGTGDVGKPGIWNTLRGDRDVDFTTAFPFIEVPPTIGPSIKLARYDVERGRCTETEAPQKTRRTQKSTKEKVTKVRSEPEVKKKTVYKETEKPVKKKKKSDDSASTAKALGLAIGIGLSIAGSKGSKKGSSSEGSRPPTHKTPSVSREY